MLLRWLRHLLQWLLALVVLFEEWGWEPLQRAFARLGRLRWVGALERWIATLPPAGALVLFVVPGLGLVPVKLAALWLIGLGHAVAGIAVIVAAKVLGTALVARLFVLTQPALMRIGWFARGYGRWIGWKSHWLARVRASWPWRAARVMRRVAQRRWARWRQS